MSVTLQILSAGAPKLGIERSARTFTHKAGLGVEITFATAPSLREKVESGTALADVLVAPVAHINGYMADGYVIQGSEIIVGSVTAGVAVRTGVEPPDISSVAKLQAALLAADGVFYNRASSGQHVADMLSRLGIAKQLAAKIERFPSGAEVMLRLAKGTAAHEIAFGQITEIRRFEGDVSLVGALPAEIGKKTTYAAGLLSSAEEPEAARALLDFMSTDEARRICTASGLD